MVYGFRGGCHEVNTEVADSVLCRFNRRIGEVQVAVAAKRSGVINAVANEMARWPDNLKSNVVGFIIVFVLFPILCWLAWWWLN